MIMSEVLGIQSLGPLGPTNFLKHAIRLALDRGVAAETIILLLLFPIVVALIAAARHLIGIRGFGVFTPALLSVALLALGAIPGVFLFLLILALATLARLVMKNLHLKIHYLARMSLLLWFICLTAFATLFWFQLSIFPILVLILLVEDFIEVQMGKSLSEAMQVTGETFVLSLASFGLLKLPWLHRFVLLQPEIVVLGTAAFNFFLGRFTGMRLLEYQRFRKLLKKS